jgi:hypothetical protein
MRETGSGRSVDGDYADQLKGMFHMVQMDREGDGQWNSIPGPQMFYAGPNQERGAAEKGAIAVGDAVGATLVYRNSPGIQHYGPYDETGRNKGNWQSKTAVDVEYCPVFNLAQYGWDKFKSSPDRATHLQRPLHAIGDLAVPHHLVGTISWGHSAYEEAVKQLFKQKAIQDPSSEEKVAAILVAAYELWSKHCSSGDLDLKAFLIDIARKNRALSGDWAFNDEATKKADLGKKENRSTPEAAQMYLDSDNFAANVQQLWNSAVVSTTAFLICASTEMKRNSLDPDTICNNGFSWEDLMCSSTPSQIPGLFYPEDAIGGMSSCETCASGHLDVNTDPFVIDIN